MAVKVIGAVCVALALSRASALEAGGANPIRKVVTLMQNMQKEIEIEGEKEKELFDKFMCYCQGNSGDLTKSVADAKAKASELAAKLKSEEAEKAATAQELVDHKKDREGAKRDLAQATSLREKESADFATLSAGMQTNLDAMNGAIPALEKGMGAASLLQTPGGSRLGKLADSFAFHDEGDRRMLQAFLEQGIDQGEEASGDYAPQSGQIVGILKQMKDELEANLKEATGEEEASAASFANLKASKEQEISVASQSIEEKQVRAGELAVTVVQTKDDLEDTEAEIADTEKFAAGLKEQCAAKTAEWAEREKTRAEEISAISEAIGILNDDDALDVFKKAIPAALVQQPGYSLLQRSGARTQATRAHRALAVLQGVAAKSTHKGVMNLMLFTLSSKLRLQAKQKAVMTAGKFEEVQKMVDDMVSIEGKEQADDDKQNPWCNGEFEKSAREEEDENTEITAFKADIEEASDSMATLDEEINTLKTEIDELDKAVTEATEQRKEEHKDYLETTQLSMTAVGLVEKAKNRMNKFYNPTIYKEEFLQAEEFLQVGMVSRVRIGAHKVAPGPAPETFGAYEKKSGKSSGVIALMESIVKELETDIKDAEYEEKTAQKDYEELMNESADTRVKKIQSIGNKEAAKAKIGEKKEATTEKEKGDEVDVDHIHQYVKDLHGECDFILENYDTRKEARATEVEALKNAKAMLAGAIM